MKIKKVDCFPEFPDMIIYHCVVDDDKCQRYNYTYSNGTFEISSGIMMIKNNYKMDSLMVPMFNINMIKENTLPYEDLVTQEIKSTIEEFSTQNKHATGFIYFFKHNNNFDIIGIAASEYEFKQIASYHYEDLEVVS